MLHRHATITPRRIRRALWLLFAATAPAAVLALAWWVMLDQPPARPHLIAGLVQSLVIIAVGSGVGALVVHSQVVVSHAFAAGVRYAQQVGLDAPEDRPALRVVE